MGMLKVDEYFNKYIDAKIEKEDFKKTPVKIGENYYFGKSLEGEYGLKMKIIIGKIIPIFLLSVILAPIAIPVLFATETYRDLGIWIREIHYNSTLDHINNVAGKMFEEKLKKNQTPFQPVHLLKNNGIESREVKLTNDTFSPQKFRDYVFRKFNNPLVKSEPANRAMFEHTVMKTSAPGRIAYHTIKAENKVENVWNKKIELPKKSVSLIPDFFKYDRPNECFVDFAHALSFGGGVFSTGCVQEERMFWEIPALTYLAFMTDSSGGVHPCVDKDGISHKTFPPVAQPQPFIVEGVHAEFDISKVPYGSPMWKLKEEEIKKGIKPLNTKIPVDVLGLAAIDWRGVKNPKYSKEQLQYMFGAAFLGFDGANKIARKRSQAHAVVHTGQWGCGVFANSKNMLIAIQYLAARASGVELALHAVSSSDQYFNEANIKKIMNEIDQKIQTGHSIATIMDDYLKLQETSSAWTPAS